LKQVEGVEKVNIGRELFQYQNITGMDIIDSQVLSWESMMEY
jgi:hypothetical protein